jgi:hypothetical protein
MQRNNNITLPRIESGRSNNSYQNDHERFNDVYKDINLANTLIKSRLERLKQNSETLKGIGKNYIPYNKDMVQMQNMRNVMKNKNSLLNPNLYANQFIEPIYYPLEMPINAEPVTLPKIEMGQPLIDPQEPKIGNFELIFRWLRLRRFTCATSDDEAWKSK